MLWTQAINAESTSILRWDTWESPTHPTVFCMRLDLLVQSCATDAYRLLQRCLHECFECRELVHDTHRLALMNAMLHDIEGQIILGDTLSNIGLSLIHI